MIDILIPVLNRPHRVQPLLQNIREATGVPYRVTFVCTDKDQKQIKAVSDSDAALWILKKGPSEYPRKINDSYTWTDILNAEHYPWVFNASDDLEFTTGWAQAVLNEAERTGASVVATNDMANSQVKKGRFGTHCLISRAYIDEQGGSLDGPGVVLHEGYDHNFVDRELCHLAQHRGEYAYAPRAIVKHHHPLHSSHVRMDATYRKGLAGFHQDQKLFLRRAQEWGYEGLNPQERKVARNLLLKAQK